MSITASLLNADFSQVFIVLQVLSFLLFFAMIFFLPKLMVWQANRRMNSAILDLKAFHNDAEEYFLENMKPLSNFEEKYDSMKNFQISEPTSLDPAGMVDRLENVLNASDHKFKRFVEKNADTEDEEELADLKMAFQGVVGTHQMKKAVQHFKELINKTGNFQIVTLVQMMLPIYKELAESQKGATRAFSDNAPIGDGIGPMIAAKMITEQPEEIADEIVHSEEKIDEQKVHVIKSKGPGARLGKYGEAVEKVTEENDLEAFITVDAASKLESEKTGSVNEGVGVMMGGPGVEKSRIEEVAVEHDIPLEGIAVKQSAPEAAKPMKKEIFEAWKPGRKKVEELVKEFDGEVAVIGVGNTCGVGNTREETQGIHNKLRKYWKEYEEQDEDEVSQMGLMSVIGGPDRQLREKARGLIWSIPRL
ncbi:MAG: DUF1512 family protein [Candidatus Nanohaloarchaea archaeon]